VNETQTERCLFRAISILGFEMESFYDLSCINSESKQNNVRERAVVWKFHLRFVSISGGEPSVAPFCQSGENCVKYYPPLVFWLFNEF
jgi:hypothetical protein